MRLAGSKQIVVKKGKATALISCISYTSCTGTVKLFASPAKAKDRRLVTKSRAARIKIASGRFDIGPNRVERLAVPLNRRGRALVAATDPAVAQLSVDGWSGNQRVSLRKAVTLHASHSR